MTEQHRKVAAENWGKFALEVKRVQEQGFYKREISALGSIKMDAHTLRIKGMLEEELTRFLLKETVSNYPLIAKHIRNVKSLQEHLHIVEAILEDILQEITFSVEDRLFLRNLENEDSTVMRNLVLQHFIEKKYWRKADLKKAI